MKLVKWQDVGVNMAGLGKCNKFIVTRTEHRYMKKNDGKENDRIRL